MIDIVIDNDRVEVGEILSGRCITKPPQDDYNRFILIVDWKTIGDGDSDGETILSKKSKSLSDFNFFTCRIPNLGPVSHNGVILKIVWTIKICGEGFLGQKPLETRTFKVIPKHLHQKNNVLS